MEDLPDRVPVLMRAPALRRAPSQSEQEGELREASIFVDEHDDDGDMKIPDAPPVLRRDGSNDEDSDSMDFLRVPVLLGANRRYSPLPEQEEEEQEEGRRRGDLTVREGYNYPDSEAEEEEDQAEQKELFEVYSNLQHELRVLRVDYAQAQKRYGGTIPRVENRLQKAESAMYRYTISRSDSSKHEMLTVATENIEDARDFLKELPLLLRNAGSECAM